MGQAGHSPRAAGPGAPAPAGSPRAAASPAVPEPAAAPGAAHGAAGASAPAAAALPAPRPARARGAGPTLQGAAPWEPAEAAGESGTRWLGPRGPRMLAPTPQAVRGQGPGRLDQGTGTWPPAELEVRLVSRCFGNSSASGRQGKGWGIEDIRAGLQGKFLRSGGLRVSLQEGPPSEGRAGDQTPAMGLS